MKISVFEKKDLFIAIFGILKNASSFICIYFEDEKMHIQGMDKSHVCLFDGNLYKNWFDTYEKDTKELEFICIDATVFFNIISSSHDSQIIHIDFKTSSDSINIELLSKDTTEKGPFNKYFKIPLANFDYELMDIPKVDYDAEFSISSKKLYEITSQMISFGNDIHIQCSEEKINLITNGIHGEMMVNIPIEDLNEYAICEGENIDINFSLNYIHKMCISTKLSLEIELFISIQYPMKIKYDLGNNSNLIFFIAPKINE